MLIFLINKDLKKVSLETKPQITLNETYFVSKFFTQKYSSKTTAFVTPHGVTL